MPTRSLLAALATIVALALGLAAGIVREMLGGGFRSIGDVEGRLGLPVLGALPRLFEEVARIVAQIREQLEAWGISAPGLASLVETERLQQAVAE